MTDLARGVPPARCWLRALSQPARRCSREMENGRLEDNLARMHLNGQPCMSSSCLPFVSWMNFITNSNDSSANKA